MRLTFLGTGAGIPTLQRNTSSIVLTLSHCGICWLFDCGEATQLQFMRSTLKIGKLQKIFITHLHGDHIFGLPGILTSRSMIGITRPLTIYGPLGIRRFVETTLNLSGSSFVSYPLDIVEIEEGDIFDDGIIKVIAFPLNHILTCFGFRVEQHDKPGCLDIKKLKEDNIPSGPWLNQLKKCLSIRLNDGRIIHGYNYIGSSIPGKKLAIFGDTIPTENAQALALQVDLIVHEATLEAALEEKANKRGHSSTIQAASLARDVQAKRLVVTHFSSRYYLEDMPRLLEECRRIFPNTELAHDFSVFEI